MTAEATLVVTQAHLDGYAAVSGDDNPIHVDPEYAATTAFALPVAHGMFLFALVRAEVRRRWPHARLAEQRLVFPAPTPVGTRVHVQLDERVTTGDTVALDVQVVHDDGTVGLTGDCVLRLDEAEVAR